MIKSDELKNINKAGVTRYK